MISDPENIIKFYNNLHNFFILHFSILIIFWPHNSWAFNLPQILRVILLLSLPSKKYLKKIYKKKENFTFNAIVK